MRSCRSTNSWSKPDRTWPIASLLTVDILDRRYNTERHGCCHANCCRSSDDATLFDEA
jgi:hypothetical protein